jgi:hypothetical protein
MGRCHEFGSQIREGCGHPMRAGERACACPECGVICQGQFDGCPGVWARGPRPVALTVAPAIEAPRVRALAAGPDPGRAGMNGPTVAAATSNGNGNGNGNAGYAAPPPPPPRAEPAQSGGTRTEILQWFEDAFDELRNELHALANTVSRQQAMLAELLDSREAELRVVMVAESLPELVGEAAAKALTDQSDGLADVVADSLDDFRASMAAADLSSVAVMDGMRELLRRVEVTAEVNAEEARYEGAARLEALKGAFGRQLKPVTAAITEIADYIAEAEEREAARTRALKASVTRQVQPLAAAVEAAMDRSDQQLAEIRAQLDAMGQARSATAAPRNATKTPVGARAATAPAKRARAKAPAPEREPEPEPEPEYEYKTRARPSAPVLLNRRRPGDRPRGSGPLAGA